MKDVISGSGEVVRFVPCVLKLTKNKFVSDVERHVDLRAPLGLAADTSQIFSKRKQARLRKSSQSSSSLGPVHVMAVRCRPAA